jgi:hypothetical protein
VVMAGEEAGVSAPPERGAPVTVGLGEVGASKCFEGWGTGASHAVEVAIPCSIKKPFNCNERGLSEELVLKTIQ